MATDRGITLYHAPNTRSFSTRVLLEELGAPYTLHQLNLKAGEQRRPAFLAVNPMGKVPTIVHDGAVVTEQAAIFLYLADLFPDAGLAPPIGDPLRGPYLRWMTFYGSSFEPAVVDRFRKLADTGPAAMLPYGDYDTTIETIAGQVRRGPWLLGERFTAADVLWGAGLGWTVMFKLVPELPEIMAYIHRVRARPAMAKVQALDAALDAAQAAPPD